MENIHVTIAETCEYAHEFSDGLLPENAYGAAGIVNEDPSGDLAPGTAVMWWVCDSTVPKRTRRMEVQRERIVVIPAGVEPAEAARILLPAMISSVLVFDVLRIGADSVFLVGNIGLCAPLVTSLAHSCGAHIIGVDESERAVAELEDAGAAQVRTSHQFPAAWTMKLTGNQGVDCVAVPVDHTAFARALSVLRPHGVLCLLANEGRPKARLAASALFDHGSAHVVCPDVMGILHREEMYRVHAQHVTQALSAGILAL